MMPFTVSQLTAHIKRLLEADRSLRGLWLEGEVSNFKRHAPSGHCYFTLKDNSAAISCVMWRTAAQQLKRLPADGEQVLAYGHVSVFEAQGKYQFYADLLQPAGLGRLYQELEALKLRLAAEGLFDQERKRPLPRWPQRIGIVTSPQAAALRDILRTLTVRYPLVEVLLAPAAVQGVEAPAQIVAAIERLNAYARHVQPIDLILLARGGGSIEELWAFNDERVVRAIAASALPIISGVGHETDFTLADLAADVRAPTPTGAAAMAVPDRVELANQVRALRQQLARAMENRLRIERRRWQQTQRRLLRESPQSQLANRRQRVDELSRRAMRLMRHRLTLRRVELNGLRARLSALDAQAVLARGYAIVLQRETGAIVSKTAQAQPGDRLRIRVSDGEFDSVVSA